MTYEEELEARCLKLEESVEELHLQNIKNKTIMDETMDYMFTSSVNTPSLNEKLLKTTNIEEIRKTFRSLGGEETFCLTYEQTQAHPNYESNWLYISSRTFETFGIRDIITLNMKSETARNYSQMIKRIINSIAYCDAISTFKSMFLFTERLLTIRKLEAMKDEVCDTPPKST